MRNHFPILMAEDDEDDRLLARESFDEGKLLNPLIIVDNGQEVLDYLQGDGKYSDRAAFPLPSLILLDLNMPIMDGRQVLEHIKGDERFRRIPVIILTTSKAEADILASYDLGAASYIAKPVTFKGMVDMMITFGRYWVEFVELPQDREE